MTGVQLFGLAIVLAVIVLGIGAWLCWEAGYRACGRECERRNATQRHPAGRVYR